MANHEPKPAAASIAREPAVARGSITPVLPLLLLETMRDMDRPAEVLEDEDLSASLPRRFGLSDVVLVQIKRFQTEVRQKRLQRTSDIEDLVRLVVRRPDASEIFFEAGRRMAQHAWSKRSAIARQTIRLLPGPLSMLSAHRALRRLFRRLAGDSVVQLVRWPPELRISDPLTVNADRSGAACALYTGVFEETLRLYSGRAYRAHHTACATYGESGDCEWQVRITSG
jgi:predicted hydrocarbon binding protein